jgi:hypothetical protein
MKMSKKIFFFWHKNIKELQIMKSKFKQQWSTIQQYQQNEQ